MAGRTRAWWLFIDAVWEIAAAAVTTSCEGVTMAGERPILAYSM
jgi:hypothetical protein